MLSVARASGKVLTVPSDKSPHGTTVAENYPHADKVGTLELFEVQPR